MNAFHVMIATERRLSYEAKYELRKAEAAKDPANVRWSVYCHDGLVTVVEDGEEVQTNRTRVEDFPTEAEAKDYAATQTVPTEIVQEVTVPPDPYPDKPLATECASQLHSMGAKLDHPDDANILYAAEWDGVSPWITVLKGNIADLKMAYAGWPMVDENMWKAANPAAAL